MTNESEKAGSTLEQLKQIEELLIGAGEDAKEIEELVNRNVEEGIENSDNLNVAEKCAKETLNLLAKAYVSL